MIPHVHSEDPSVWSARAMRAHLLRSHHHNPPMAWGVGELHQAHLKAHQTSEETTVSEIHNHGGDIARFHDTISRFTLANHLEQVHGLKRQDIDLRELYSQHDSLHPMVVELCDAENPQYPGEYACEYPAGHGPVIDPDDGDMPITGTFDHGAPSKGAWWTMPPTGTAEADKVENLAQLLYDRDADGPQPDWDDLGQETRDHYRDRARTSLARVRNGRINRVNQAAPTEGERRILEDRIICAMTGLDFDGTWARDDSLSLRGALRTTYAATADRLVTWLEHGGALHLAPVASLETDLEQEKATVEQLTQHLANYEEKQRDLEETNNTLREQLAVTGRQLTEVTGERDLLRTDKARLKTDLEDMADERNHALEAVMGAQSKAADLRSQLEDSQRQRQGLFEEMGELRQQLERAQEAGYRLECERDEAIERQTDAVEHWQHAVRAHAATEAERNSLAQRLASRTEALANGQAGLGELVSTLEREGWKESTVLQRLKAILDGSRLKAGVVTACTEPHLGLARTREILAELTTRIEIGHCGLDYRTVDDH